MNSSDWLCVCINTYWMRSNLRYVVNGRVAWFVLINILWSEYHQLCAAISARWWFNAFNGAIQSGLVRTFLIIFFFSPKNFFLSIKKSNYWIDTTRIFRDSEDKSIWNNYTLYSNGYIMYREREREFLCLYVWGQRANNQHNH